MPTVLRVDGFSFRFYSNDHDPPHVHVRYAGTECRINLATLVVEGVSMKEHDRARAVRLVAAHLDVLMAAWLKFSEAKGSKR